MQIPGSHVAGPCMPQRGLDWNAPCRRPPDGGWGLEAGGCLELTLGTFGLTLEAVGHTLDAFWITFGIIGIHIDVFGLHLGDLGGSLGGP